MNGIPTRHKTLCTLPPQRRAKFGPAPIDLQTRLAVNSCNVWTAYVYREPCLIWTLGEDIGGYGKIGVAGKTMKVHRLAWMLANGPIPEETPCLMHLCDVRRCFRLSHLTPCTLAENNADMMVKRRSADHWGEGNNHAKLTDDRVLQIRAMKRSGMVQNSIAQLMGVSAATISEIVNGKTWAHL